MAERGLVKHIENNHSYFPVNGSLWLLLHRKNHLLLCFLHICPSVSVPLFPKVRILPSRLPLSLLILHWYLMSLLPNDLSTDPLPPHLFLKSPSSFVSVRFLNILRAEELYVRRLRTGNFELCTCWSNQLHSFIVVRYIRTVARGW